MSYATCSIPLSADPVLPQRDLLLDPDFMADLFSRNLGTSGSIKVDRCEHLRTTYHAGESLRVAYRISAGEHSCVVAGRAFPEGHSEKNFEQPRKNINSGPFRPVFRDAETESVFWTFPNDRKITKLHMLVDIPPELAQLFASQWTRSSVVAYAPEKCATAQCLSAHNEVLGFAKIYVDDQSQGCFNTYMALRQSADVSHREICFPEVIYHSCQLRILILEAMRGQRIAELKGSRLREAFIHLGRALACLHSLPAPSHLSEFPRSTNSYMQLAARSIALVRPELAQLALELCDELRIAKKEQTEPNVWLHGDVHPKNGLLLGQTMALIDVDQAALGPASADLGSLLAALRYDRMIGSLTKTEEGELADAFLSGYREAGSLPAAESLRFHMAAALFAERSFRSVSRIRLPGLQCLPEILNEIRRVLAGDMEGCD